MYVRLLEFCQLELRAKMLYPHGIHDTIRALNFSLAHSEAIQPSCCGASSPLMSEFLLFASVCMCVPASSLPRV